MGSVMMLVIKQNDINLKRGVVQFKKSSIFATCLKNVKSTCHEEDISAVKQKEKKQAWFQRTDVFRCGTQNTICPEGKRT